MRVALVAPVFIPVPPKNYGGTELFISHLAEGLLRHDVEVLVYTNGESTVPVEKKWLYPESQWPIEGEVYDNLKDINHSAWAIQDAASCCDLIHVNNVAALAHSRFVDVPFIYTVHHQNEPEITAFYKHYPRVQYVTISDFQRVREQVPKVCTIHHGIDVTLYQLKTRKQSYLAFLGRICPLKGTHLAIDIAKRTGIPLKIAGEVQPVFRDYFESKVKPHIDGKFIEYIGEVNLAAKNELLGNAMATLFPIQWDEPFGLVMVESMACGTPVLALPGGSVAEIVENGTSGFVCESLDEIVDHLSANGLAQLDPSRVREYVARNFSVESMVSKYVALYTEVLNAATSALADNAGSHSMAA